MDDFFGSILMLIVGITFGFLFGCLATVENWQTDCQKLGTHYSQGKIFKCVEAIK
jgi:hypothetical protein